MIHLLNKKIKKLSPSLSFTLLLSLWLSLSLTSCNSAKESWREKAEQVLNERKEILKEGNLFAILDNKQVKEDEKPLLEFLYAYMPLGDMADYDGEFWLGNVREAMAARKEANWQMPDDIFRHFVLPLRVNNENLDSARFVFRKEITPRIKGMNMRDAVLEVNHWCHEHVTYQPSDARTSSPLATLKTAWGRCGEESTFLVTALRSVGIPARQVYTPRWAHTDDNHAWVEAWVDGEWCFLGACEPEPVLNLGWFNSPASRGLLMHTKVFGDYQGQEEVMTRTNQYTEINVIANYAKCAPATVIVKDADGKLAVGAKVEWKIYNYAEFYTVSRQTADEKGESKLTAGLGDMLVMAFKGDKFGYSKVTFGSSDALTITLNHTVGEEFEDDIDIVPPMEGANLPEVTPEQRATNDLRLAKEDSIRNAYRATFPKKEDLSAYPEEEQKLILTSEGNYQTIMHMLNNKEVEHDRAVAMLQTLSEKDLRDGDMEILYDHLLNTPADVDVKHILAPRIADERLTPWRGDIPLAVLEKETNLFKGHPEAIEKWCKDNISLHDELTIGGTYMSPIAVWNTRVADTKSLPVFFVAMCRAFEMEAWVDAVTGYTFYKKDGKVVKAKLTDADEEKTFDTAKLQLNFTPQTYVQDAEYVRHFTLAHFDNEHFNLLTYPDFTPCKELFGKPAEVEKGYYQLTTGCRLANGGVMVHLHFFNLDADKQVPLVLRQDETKISVIGSFNSEAGFNTPEGEATTILKTAGRGYFVVGLLGVDQEPTNHALKDIALRKAELEKWGRPIVLLFSSDTDYQKYMVHPIEGLPSTVVFGIDKDHVIQNEIITGIKLAANSPLPLFIVADTFNRVVFESHGYTIGMGDRIVKVISD